MFGSRFGISVVTLALLVSASFVSAQEEPAVEDVAEKNAEPQLILKTDEAFVHFAPWAPPREARWDWSPYGELYLTRRDDGTMVRLLSSGVEALPTRRMKYVETRIAAVGVVKDQLVAVVWRAVSWDRPPAAWAKERPATPSYAAGETLSLIKSVQVFSMTDGKPSRPRSLTDVECERLKELPDLPPTNEVVPIALTEEQAAKFLSVLEEDRPTTP